MAIPKIEINWNEVKGRDGVIELVNRAYDEGYAKGTQEGWTKHKAATENGAPKKNGKKSKKDEPPVLVTVGNARKETEKAFMFEVRGREIWLPKSQLRAINLDDHGKIESVLIPKWLAKSNNLEEINNNDEPDGWDETYNDDDIPF